MKTRRSFSLLPLLLLLAIAIILFSCEKEASADIDPKLQISDLNHTESSEKTNEFYGPTQPFGKGIVRSAVTLNSDGEPVSVAVLFSEKALLHTPHHHEELSLELHKKADGIIIDHIDFGWNPEGHEPFFYEVPHFDFHFYWISMEEKFQILPGMPEGEIFPASQFWPEDYVPTPGYVPFMGKHWIDPNSNEFGPNGFNRTFIFGSFDGDFIFHEPMITKEYFLSGNSSESIPIPQPSAYEQSGYYPTSYSISFDPVKKLYRVSLDNMQWFPGVED